MIINGNGTNECGMIIVAKSHMVCHTCRYSIQCVEFVLFKPIFVYSATISTDIFIEEDFHNMFQNVLANGIKCHEMLVTDYMWVSKYVRIYYLNIT